MVRPVSNLWRGASPLRVVVGLRMADQAIVGKEVARVAAKLSARADELAGDMVNLYARELPHLVQDDESVVSLLSASLYQNIDTALRIFQHGIDPTRVEAPAAAMEYARRLAQRGTPVIDLIRAYYLAQTAILKHAVQVAREDIEDPEVMSGMMGQALTITFAFIDRVIQQVVDAYQQERDRWLLNRRNARRPWPCPLQPSQTSSLMKKKCISATPLRNIFKSITASSKTSLLRGT